MTGDLEWLAGAEPALVAEIHATVDLERELTARGEDPARAAAAVPDPLLGARIVALANRLVLAEPSTEGRLAASLARHDEGVVGRYLEAPAPLKDVARRAAAAGVTISRPADGPFGREVLVLGPPAGSHVLLVEPPAHQPVPSRG